MAINNDHQDESSMMTSESSIKSPLRASFRLLVPANSAGSIIGQKGEFIKKVRNSCQSEAYLRVPEIPHSSERLVLISCDVDEIPSVIRQLCKPIFKALRDEILIPEEHQNEILLLVHSQQAGRLVGKGGEKLKDLRVETGCKRFKIYKDRLPFSEERVCEIVGEEDSVALAVQMALDILSRNPVDYDHLNYVPLPDGVMERGDYGGYARFAARHQSQDLRAQLSTSSYSENEDLRNSRLSVGSRHNMTSSRQDNMTSSSRHHDRNVMERDRSPIRGSGVKTKDIYVDDCYTRHVIGSKGSQIEKIRNRSGATVQVADDETVQNNERKIAITGRQSDIDLALKLINEAIATRINIDRKNTNGGGGEGAQQQAEHFDYVNELFDRISSVVPFKDINNNDLAEIEDEMMVSNHDTSTIIGPRGIRINDMRQYTKCEIHVQNDTEVVNDQRKVTFKGTPRQVHRAMYMIQNIGQVMR